MPLIHRNPMQLTTQQVRKIRGKSLNTQILVTVDELAKAKKAGDSVRRSIETRLTTLRWLMERRDKLAKALDHQATSS